jgi:glycosyltransferase involved in cell wall biosynthesis
VIAGPNDADLADAAQPHPNLHLLGMVSDAHLPALLRQSLALVFLSLYEGFGIPPLEAMATGTPAIVANRASLPEVVGPAGIIVEPTDSVAIADHCHRLLTDTAHREQMQQKSRSHAAGYRWEKCTDTILQTLHERSR